MILNEDCRCTVFNIDLLTKATNAVQREILCLKEKLPENVNGAIYKYFSINICSLLEEWDRLYKLNNESNIEDLTCVLTIVEPIITAVNEYKGITEARNSLIAHFNRDKKKRFLPYWSRIDITQVPLVDIEIHFIMNNLTTASTILCSKFYSEIMELSKQESEAFQSFLVGLQNKSVDKELEQELINKLTQVEAAVAVKFKANEFDLYTLY